jgi:hypothetical protein
MTFTINNKQFSKLLLVIYFLAYSISPLTYTLSDNQVHKSIYATNKESSNIKSVHIWLWEFFIDRLSSEENSHNNGTASILIKKKRAIAPENDSGKLSLFKNTSVPKYFYNPLVLTIHSSNVLLENILGISKGFNPVYAGNSPPTV